MTPHTTTSDCNRAAHAAFTAAPWLAGEIKDMTKDEIIKQHQRGFDCYRKKAELDMLSAMKANAILRAAMYDIIELESRTLPATVVAVMAENALAASALDEHGRLAESANDAAQRP